MPEQNFTEAELAILSRVDEIRVELKYYCSEMGKCSKRFKAVGSNLHVGTARVKAVLSEAINLMEQ